VTNSDFALKLSKSRSLVRQVLARETQVNLTVIFARYREFHTRFPHFFRFKDEAEAKTILEQAFQEVTGGEQE
jgi:hypothetical protein